MIVRSRYRSYLLAILLVVLAFNGVDRLTLGLLLQNIKADLHLSDTQLGLLSGIAFALFYSIMGVPIARWADRGNRIVIIAVTCLLWSIAVALCGVAANFLQLLVIRVAVAVGEAGCLPAANSLIADYFTRAERPKAVSIYMLGASLSSLIGSLLAGWLNAALGWRLTFIIVGLPGVALAAIAWFTLKEPRLLKSDLKDGSRALSHVARPSSSSAELSLREVCSVLWGNETFLQLLLGFAVLSFCGAGIWQWIPTFFIRSHGVGTAELGTWYGLIYGLGGMIGTYTGGALASRYAMHDEALQLKSIAILYCAFGAIAAAIFLSPSFHVALGLMSIAMVGICTVTGPLFATIQTLVPERMRALAIALIYLFANLVGMGLGPLAVGILSDGLRPFFGDEALRYALFALCPVHLWGAWHLWRASKTVARDVGAGRKGEKDDLTVRSVTW